MGRRYDLRCQLTKNENDQSQDYGSNDAERIDMLLRDIGSDDISKQACGCNVGNGISQEDHAQKAVGLFDDLPDCLCLLVAGFRLILQTRAVQAHESNFGTCKKHRKTQEENEKNDINQQG